MKEHQIYDRVDDGVDTLSAKSFNMLIGLVLFWGFFVNYLMVKFISTEGLLEINPFLFFIGYFVCCMIGIKLYTSSDDPKISFLGYNLVVIPFGLIINIVVSAYQPGIVLSAIITTGMVTLIMMTLGYLFPAFFEKISGVLFMALLVAIVVNLIQIFIFRTDLAIMDWIVALIFCGYIGLDWGRANKMTKTVDNAIDGAAAIYMDIINLFLRILRILGRSRD